jgi:pyrroline-5-carboxylate reductase
VAAKFTLGVIGVGNMGAALVRGILRAGALPPQQITIADPDVGKTSALAGEFGMHVSADNARLVGSSEYVVIAVKPNTVGAVMKEISGSLASQQSLVSIAAGVTLSSLSGRLPQGISPALIRVMPNTPALVGAGAMAVAPGPGATEDRVEKLTQLLRALGEVVVVDETLMDAVTGLSGSGPAFVFVMVEALADAGVAAGLPRPVALKLAAQTVYGAGKLVVESGQHPGALKEMVASPGGTTIAGLAELEKAGFRGAVLSAVKAAANRSRELSRG